jgi:hypothetical protein
MARGSNLLGQPHIFHPKELTCPECNRRFFTRGPRQRFCERSCASKAQRRRDRDQLRKLREQANESANRSSTARS